MAIEPLGSMMSVQAQTVAPPPRQMTEAAEPVEEYSNANAEASNKIDTNLRIVENADEKGQSNNAADQRSKEKQTQSTNEQIKKAVEELNKRMNSVAEFGIHEGTNRVTIKIVDKDSKKVIKELPPEKTLDMIAKVWDMAGILVDEKR